MLSGASWDSGSHTVTFDADAYVKIVDGTLYWGDSLDSLSNDLDTDTSGVQSYSVGDGDLRIKTPGDEDKTVYLSDMWMEGSGLQVDSDNISILPDATVSTRTTGGSDPLSAASTGDSGSASFYGKTITIQTGGSLVADVGGSSSYAAGDVRLDVEDIYDEDFTLVDELTLETSVSLTGATVRGGQVVIESEADAGYLYEGEDFGDTVIDFADTLSLAVGGAFLYANSFVRIDGGQIEADDLIIDSRAETYAASNVGSLYFALSGGYSAPKSKVTITGGAEIEATGDVTVNSESESGLDLRAAQAIVGYSTVAEKFNVTLAIGKASSTTVIDVTDESSIVAGGDVTLASDLSRYYSVSSSAAAYADGSLGIGFALSIIEDTVRTAVDDSTIDAGGSVAITAETQTVKNDVASDATVGSSLLTAGGSTGNASSIFSTITSFLSSGMNLFNTWNRTLLKGAGATTSTQTWGGSASVSFGWVTQDVTARIGTGSSPPASTTLWRARPSRSTPRALPRTPPMATGTRCSRRLMMDWPSARTPSFRWTPTATTN